MLKTRFSAKESRSPVFSVRRLAVLPVAFIVALLLLSPSGLSPEGAAAQSQQFHMEPYDSNITVNGDGSLSVEEILTYVYDSGSFHRGTRYWDLNRIEQIQAVGVTEEANGLLTPYTETSYDPDASKSGQPGTFGTTTENGQFKVRWVYDYTSSASRTFHLKYRVPHAIKVYSDHDEFDWYAIPPNWAGPISRSRARVTFPASADTSAWTKTSVPKSEVTAQANSITWTASSGLDQGFELGAKLPKGVVTATQPSWQSGIDAQNQYNDRVKPFVD
ncbi:MAG: DUF2207 domain-containing protein, partial [Chloroflexota bacterium]|nr:DUF2207 domain-containing protein [Chloroflexota bacterium]